MYILKAGTYILYNNCQEYNVLVLTLKIKKYILSTVGDAQPYK